jgi:hypothetical protein
LLFDIRGLKAKNGKRGSLFLKEMIREPSQEMRFYAVFLLIMRVKRLEYRKYCIYTTSQDLPLIPMKVHQLLSSPEVWCKESPAEDSWGNKVQPFDPGAVKWCALGAIQKVYPPSDWGKVMDRLLLGLSYSNQGIAQMNESDKACSIMEWNDDHDCSFEEIREILKESDI